MSNYVGRGLTSPPLDCTHSRTTSGVALHHRLWTTHTVERRQRWHAIIAFGQHSRSNDVGRGMTSPPLDSTHSQTTSGVACHHRLWAAFTIERGRAWHDITALGQHTRSATSSKTCHHRPWTALKVERRRARHAIIAFGQHTPSHDVGRGRTSPPLDSTHDQTTSGVACHHCL